jgi:hypothetical protein
MHPARAQIEHERRPRDGAGPVTMALALLTGLIVLLPAARAVAQEEPSPSEGWAAGVDQETSGTTTTVIRAAPEGEAGAPAAGPARVRLVALLTSDGQKIDKGLVWRVFQGREGTGAKSKLIGTHREASPTLELEPGEYLVSASFGRAHLTRKLNVKAAATPAVEQFVINAGGLRLQAVVGGAAAPASSVSYDILSDRDQTDSRKVVMSGAKPGLVIRLNAGIYHIVSTYGDANASVESDVTVEAGKLTEAQVVHAAAKATFKLVTRPGGEALSDTQWTIQTKDGRLVKESMGALPTHVFAPGTYFALARHGGQTFSSEFALADGELKEVEVVMAAAP